MGATWRMINEKGEGGVGKAHHIYIVHMDKVERALPVADKEIS